MLAEGFGADEVCGGVDVALVGVGSADGDAASEDGDALLVGLIGSEVPVETGDAESTGAGTGSAQPARTTSATIATGHCFTGLP